MKLDTNGRDPALLKKLIDEDLVDYIAMDVKHTWEKYPSLVGKLDDISPYQESVEIIRMSAKDYEFRTTVISPYHTYEDIREIAQSLQWVKRYFLQSFRTWSVLESAFDGYPPGPTLLEEMRNIARQYLKECHVR